MKRIYLIGVICMLCALVGCNNSNESNTEQIDASGGSGNKDSKEVNFTQTEKPPSLTIAFGEKVIKTRLGGYSWRFLDLEGQTVNVEADSMPSTEIVNLEDAVSVNLNEPIMLNLEKEPLHYEIRIYHDNDEMMETYNNFKEVKEKGKAIYEILATWEEGTGIYAVALDIQ